MPKATSSTDTAITKSIATIEAYGIFTLSPEGIVLTWNQGSLTVQGYPPKETLGKPFAPLYELEVGKKQGYFDELLDKAREQGWFEEEGWRQRKSGVYYWSTILITPIYDAQKLVQSYTVVSRDITDRKLVAELSEITEASSETFVLATSNITWTRAPDGQFTAPHLQWENFTGQIWPEYQGFGWLTMHPPEEHEKIKAFWKTANSMDWNGLKGNWQALQQPKIRETLTLKTRLWSKIHQEYRHVVTSIVPRLGAKKIDEWLGNEKDVHPMTVLGLQLKEAAELQRLMVSSARLGLWRWDLKTNKFMIDENVAHYFGIDAKTFHHSFHEILSCVHTEDKPLLENLLPHCLQTSKPYNAEFRVIWPDGTIHHMVGRGQVDYDEQHNATQIVGSYWDITESKLLFEQQIRAEGAERQCRQQAEFVDTVCHEMRNPLNGINGSLTELSQMLKIFTVENVQQFTPEELAAKCQQLQRNIEVIEDCARHQEKVIDRVTELSEIHSDRWARIKQTFSLSKVIHSLVKKQQQSISAKGLVLNCEVQTDCWVYNDKASFKKILSYILSQAVTSTPPKGIITITLNILREENHQIQFEVCIEDASSGFTPQETANLFERYMPVTHHQDANYDEGQLGLAVSKALTHRLHGTFEVGTEKDKGNKFHLTFNWERGLQPTAEITQDQANIPSSIKRTGNSILIVDDNAINQTVLKRMLEIKGYQCNVANNGQEAIDSFLLFKPDLILMDLEMPRIDGFEATKIIREIEAKQGLLQTPICAITGYSREEYRIKASQVFYS